MVRQPSEALTAARNSEPEIVLPEGWSVSRTMRPEGERSAMLTPVTPLA